LNTNQMAEETKAAPEKLKTITEASSEASSTQKATATPVK